MLGEILEMISASRRAAPALTDERAVTPMISSVDFDGMTKNTAALIEAVVQTNLRATQELLRAKSPEEVLELQQRFVREYLAVLMQGAMTFVGAVELAAG
jgi:hypothetical protein